MARRSYLNKRLQLRLLLSVLLRLSYTSTHNEADIQPQLLIQTHLYTAKRGRHRSIYTNHRSSVVFFHQHRVDDFPQNQDDNIDQDQSSNVAKQPLVPHKNLHNQNNNLLQLTHSVPPGFFCVLNLQIRHATATTLKNSNITLVLCGFFLRLNSTNENMNSADPRKSCIDS